MLFLCALKWTKLSWVIKYDWWPCLQACLHVVLVCTLVHCLHVEITHASTGARQVYDYFHKGFPCMWKPLLSSQWFICRVTSPQPVPIFTSRIGETLWSLQYLAQEQDALPQLLNVESSAQPFSHHAFSSDPYDWSGVDRVNLEGWNPCNIV